MSVGSTFKLYVLDVLYDKLGANSGEKVIRLKEKNQSLPSGILQDWPICTPITLKTLSHLMISQSDNTATDHIIDFVSRETLEKNASPKNKPFLKTREFFILKYGVDPKTREEYITGDEEAKRKILNRIEKLQVDKSEVSGDPSKPARVDTP